MAGIDVRHRDAYLGKWWWKKKGCKTQGTNHVLQHLLRVLDMKWYACSEKLPTLLTGVVRLPFMDLVIQMMQVQNGGSLTQ